MLVATFKDRAGLVGDFWLAFRWCDLASGEGVSGAHHHAFPDPESATRWLAQQVEEYGEPGEYYLIWVHPAKYAYVGMDTVSLSMGDTASATDLCNRETEIRKAIERTVELGEEAARKHVTILSGKRN